MKSPHLAAPVPDHFTLGTIVSSGRLGSARFLILALAILPALPMDAAGANGETIVLNPFVVGSAANQGYYASETLSGTQLKAQVRDLANPITILTEEFMRDIGAVN